MEVIEKEVQRVLDKASGLGVPSSSSRVVTSKSPSKTSKSKDKESNANVVEALDELIKSLEVVQSSVQSGSKPPVLAAAQSRNVLLKAQKTVNERHKEYYNTLIKLDRSLDKKFPTPIDGVADANLFTNNPAQNSLSRVVRDHLERCGEWETAKMFDKEAQLALPERVPSGTFQSLHATISEMRRGDLSRAIAWAEKETGFLDARGSQLEFALHRSQFLRLALGLRKKSHEDDEVDEILDEEDEEGEKDHFVEAQERMAVDPDGEALDDGDEVMPSWSGRLNADGDDVTMNGHSSSRARYSVVEEALNYGRRYLRPTQTTHLEEMKRLFTFLLFLPTLYASSSTSTIGMDKLSLIPLKYHAYLDDRQMHSPALIPLFQREFTARMGVARDPPLKVAVEVGAGGALNRIIKVRSLMKERGNEWSQADELPVEIPLPSHLHFHSTFTCPVSKEQGTDENPPMMMACGHVLCQESLHKLAKGTNKVKCPYCPIESTISQAMRVHF